MEKKDWNPELYLKYNKERIQPSIDLVARIDYENPQSIIDIGCGPGNSTQILNLRWINAQITGMDNSPAMIEKAKEDYPDQEWILADAGKDTILGTYDIVFSNATIQWIPDHVSLIRKFSQIVNERGVLAVQIPLYLDMPISKSINKVAESGKWKELASVVNELFTINTPSFYYDELSCYFSKIDMWTTYYHHIMSSHSAIIEMIRSTGMKPFLDKLTNEEDKKEFENQVLNKIKEDYPEQKDGKVLFPFKRLFFIAIK